MTKLIYLHIPKSGGTSQRMAFYDLYGEERVFWHGINSPLDENTSFDERFQDYVLVGGHKPITFYPANLEALYLTVIREPISRAVSLYSYYAKPDFAEPHLVDARKRGFKVWQERGIDSESLINSLERCPEFLNEIKNYQCRYLSRYDNTFEGVLRTLKETNIVISELDSMTAVNAHLSKLLGWGYVRERRANRSLDDTHDFILKEAGVEEALTELLKEDTLLYNYVAHEHQGLYSSVSEHVATSLRAGSRGRESEKTEVETPWNQIQMYSKGFIGLTPEGRGSLGIAIINHSKVDIDYRKYSELSICYSPYDSSGLQIGAEVFSQPMQVPLKAQGKLTLSLEVDLPDQLLSEASGIRIWLALTPSQPLTNFNPLHLASAQIFPI